MGTRTTLDQNNFDVEVGDVLGVTLVEESRVEGSLVERRGGGGVRSGTQSAVRKTVRKAASEPDTIYITEQIIRFHPHFAHPPPQPLLVAAAVLLSRWFRH